MLPRYIPKDRMPVRVEDPKEWLGKFGRGKRIVGYWTFGEV